MSTHIVFLLAFSCRKLLWPSYGIKVKGTSKHSRINKVAYRHPSPIFQSEAAVSRLQFFIVYLNPNGIDHISNRAWKSCLKMLQSMIVKKCLVTWHECEGKYLY